MLVPAIPLGAIKLRYPHFIENSMHIQSGEVGYMRRNQIQGDRQKFTYSVWYRNDGDDSGTTNDLLYGYYDSDHWTLFGSAKRNAGGQLYIQHYYSGKYNYILRTDTIHAFTDASGFYHFVFSVDSTQSNALDRAKFYVNGIHYPSELSTVSPPPLNWQFYFNVSSYKMYTGGKCYSSHGYTHGHFAMSRYIDGQALAADSFGEFIDYKGQSIWVPKEYEGDYGLNGFALDFEDAADLGADTNGSNSFDIVSGAISQSLDTPTDTFAVRDPNTGYPSIRPTRGKWAWKDETPLARGGTASASGYYSSPYTPEKAFDGSWATDNGWVAPSSEPDHWLAYTFSAPVRPGSYTIYSTKTGSATPLSWRIEGYNGSEWEVLDTKEGVPAWNDYEIRTFPLALSSSYIAIRLYIVEGGGYVRHGIAELGFSNNIVTLDLDALEPDLRPVSVCMGGTAASNSSFSGYTPTSCFNKTTNEVGWLSANTAAGVYVQYTFPRAVKPMEYRVSLGTGLSDRQVRDWTVEGYDGSSWEVVDTQTDQTGWTAQETRSYPLDLSKHYTAFRLNCIANNGGEYFGIAELDFFETFDANGIPAMPEAVNFGADGSWEPPAGYWQLSVEGCIRQGIALDEYQHILNAEVL